MKLESLAVVAAVLFVTTGSMLAEESPIDKTSDVRISVSFPHPVILPNSEYKEALKLEVAGSAAAAVQSIRATVASGEVELATGDVKGTTTVNVAIERGATTKVTLRTKSPGYFVIKLEVLGAGEAPLEYENEKKEKVEIRGGTDYFVARVSEGYTSGFMSDRVASDLFLGATYANEYDKDGKNGGFGSAAPVARLTFDTIWHPGIREDREREGAAKTNRRYGETCTARDGIGNCSKHRTVHAAGLVHTGMEMQFADFPFGSAEGVDQVVERSDSFTGALYVLYQPDLIRWMTSYTDTSSRPDKPWDAVRWGVLAKAGFTTRLDRKATDADHDISRYALGLKLTHHQTAAPGALDETVNYLPMRFAEISGTWFEEWPTEDPQHPREGQLRLVVDAGMRLPGAGSEIIPFYAGIHANAGRGPDDLRVFAGFVFQINELVRLFEGAGQVGK